MRSTLFVICMLLVSGILQAQIYSTTTGGTWNDPSTWEGGVVPGSTDDVFIRATVSVNSTCYCNNLMVESTGILQNHASTNYTLYVGGYLYNYGVVRDNSHYLNLYLDGNLNNEGSIANHSLTFSLAATQHVTITQDATFAPTYLYCSTGAVGTLIADSDLTLSSVSNFDGNGATLDLTGGWVLTYAGSLLSELVITGGNNAELNSTGSSSCQNCTISSCRLLGTHRFYGTTSLYDCINDGLLYNNSNGNNSVSLYGTFANNGTVAGNPSGYVLNMYVYGDLTNNGTWTPYLTYLIGTQELGCGAGCSFGGTSIYNTNASSVDIAAVSDLSFTASNIYFGGHALDLSSGPYDLTYSGRLDNFAITGGTGSTLTGGASSNVVSSSGSNLVLVGTQQIASGCVFTNITNEGIFQNDWNGNASITINGDFVNTGTMRNNPSGYILNLTLNGSVVNNGTWNVYSNTLSGAGPSTLELGAGCIFQGSLFACTTTADTVLAASDLTFQFSSVDFNSHTLDLSAGPFNLDLNCSFQECTLIGGAGAVLTGYGYALKSTTATSFLLTGTVSVESNVVLYDVLNQGTLQNYASGNYTLTIHDDFVNQGIVRSNPSGYALNLTLNGSIENNGTWNTYSTTLAGAGPWSLELGDGCVFQGSSFVCNTTADTVLAASHLTFLFSNVDFNSHTLDLSAGGYCLDMNSALQECTLLGGDGSIYTGHGYVLKSTTARDFILDGTVSVENSVVFYNVENQGTLQNYASANYTLTINGDFFNAGAVRSNPSGYSLYVAMYGNIVNYGTWSSYSTTLSGDGPWLLELDDGCVFQGTSFVCSTTADTVFAVSDLTFQCGTVDFNSHTLDLSAGPYDATFNGVLQECNVVGGSGSILTGSGQYLSSVTGSNLILAGTWCVNNSSVTLTDVRNTGILQNYAIAHQSLYIHGNFTNLGTIRNNPGGYTFNVYADANVTQDGVWNTYSLYLNGAADQTLTTPNDSLFTISYLYDTNNASAVLAGSDLHFYGCTLDFNSAQLDLTYASRTPRNLILENCTLREVTVIGEEGVGLYGTGSTQLTLCDISNVTTYGSLVVISSVSFTNLVNEGVIQNDTSGYQTLSLYGLTKNNGTMRNHPNGYGLILNLYGSLKQNGTLAIYRINCQGTTPQTFSCAGGSTYAVSYFYSYNTTDSLTFISSIPFEYTAMELGNALVMLTDNATLSLTGGYAKDFTLQTGTDCILQMSNNAYLQSATLDSLRLEGAVLVRDGVVGSNLINYGVLSISPNASHTLTLSGRFDNYGTVQDNAYSMYLTVTGDLYNYGTIQVTRIDFNGPADQYVQFELDAPIASPARLYSNIGSGAWYNFDENLNYTNTYYSLPQITANEFGLYHALSGTTWSRDIRLWTYPEQPQNVLIAESGAVVTLTWNEAARATSYTLYAADDPQGVFSVLETGIVDGTPGDGVVTWSFAAPSVERRYYRVVAAN